MYNLVNICKYPEDSIDRIIRDVLIIGCNSNSARDKIIRQGEVITLNQVIEILQTEESTRSTMQQIQEFQGKPVQSVNYVSYDSRSKKSKKPSNEQNSSSSNSTGSAGPTSPKKRKCFQCGEPFSRKHLQECRAQNVTCDGCGIKGHFKRCCKKSGNFPKDNSNRENQSSSTGSKRYAAAIPEADFFDERGNYKEYRPPAQHPAMQQQIGSMNILRKVHNPDNAILISEDGVETQITSTLTSGPVSVSVPTPDFPFTEFPSTEVVTQSQTDLSSISDTLHPRENTNSSSKAFKDTDSPLKYMQSRASHEEMEEIGDPAVSVKHTQSTRDPTTISIPGNSNFRKSTPGTKADISTALPVETSVSFATEDESRSIMPTDDQALMALQDLLSDDFQSKNSNSLQRKGEDKKDEAFQLIQKIHNQLQQVQWDLQKLHSLHKYEF